MRVKTLTIAACVATGLALAGCRYINYHPYDVDVDGEKMVNVTNAHHAVMTMTLKQDYIPWTVHVAGELVDFQPLAAGLYFNTAFSHKFWVHQPSRYPKGYYWFATRVRTNVYLGQRIRLNIPERKRWFGRSVSLFYELSTCDYYFIQKVKNSYITPDKWLTLSFGIQIEWL